MAVCTAFTRRYVYIASAIFFTITLMRSAWTSSRIDQKYTPESEGRLRPVAQNISVTKEQKSISTSKTQLLSIEQQEKPAAESYLQRTKKVDSGTDGLQGTTPSDAALLQKEKNNAVTESVQKTTNLPSSSTQTFVPTQPLQTHYSSTNVTSSDTLHWLNISAPGWQLDNSKLSVRSVFAEDPGFKQVEHFTIEPLVDFFPHQPYRRNPDNSTYENWLSMTFPPNANWDQGYKTPCYTDYNTSIFRCIPHIYVVGWAKSGTTDLWWHLNRHPQLVHGYKETQFLTQFSFWEDHKAMKNFTQLLWFFDKRSEEEQLGHPEKIMYDATATIIYDNWHWRIKQGYAGDPHVPTHTNFHYLRKIHPSAQIVVLMRNPVTRALSFYNHGVDMSVKNNANLKFTYVQMPKSSLDIHKFFVDSIRYFEECVSKTSLRACCHLSGWESQHWGDPKYFMTLRIGIYYIFLEEVYKNFSPSQVHLVKSEEFYNSPIPTLSDLYSFMNISTDQVPLMVHEKGSHIMMSVEKYFTPLPATYRLLQQFYAPFNKRLSSMLGDDKWLEWETELQKYTRFN